MEEVDEYAQWEKSHTLSLPPPPSLTYTRYLDNGYAPHQEFQVSKAEGLRLAPLGYRMYRYIQKETSKGRLPVMNPFKKANAGPRMGVPVGGFGSGTIGRGWRGDWGRNYLFQGFPNYNIVDINAFSVSVSSREDGSDGSGSVMTYGKCDNNKEMSKVWRYNLKGSNSYYQGLYPRAWTTYEEDPNVKLVCRQMSPVIPHNYRESSYPVGTFKWIAENTSSSVKYVNIMFSFLNGTGDPNDSSGGHFNRSFHREVRDGGREGVVHAIALHHQVKQNERIQRLLKEAGKADGTKAAALKMLKSTDDDDDDEDDSKAGPSLLRGVGQVDPLIFGIGVYAPNGSEFEVSYDVTLNPNDKKSLRDVWERFETSTKLSCSSPPASPTISSPTPKGQEIAGCLMVRLAVPPESKRSVTFALGWDMPIVRFNSGRGYYRRYTKFYGRDGNAIEDILCDALLHDTEWEEQIEAWQKTILGDKNLPGWYKQALFNELYYLAEGGSVWTDGEIGKEKEEEGGESKGGGGGGGGVTPPQIAKSPSAVQRMTVSMDAPVSSNLQPTGGSLNPPLVSNFTKQVNEQLCNGASQPKVDLTRYSEITGDVEEGKEDAYETMGQFGYLESMEYLMVNTYDVHFYASWALIQLWPLLDLTIQRDFARSTLYDEYDIIWRTLHSGKKAKRKVRYAVPHDLGNPGDDPWYRVNSYNIQEINSWKDLNCKFVLQVYRDYRVTKNRKFLFECWNAVEEALKYISKFDKDGDGLIENEGFPDQTYDTWSALGASAYSGGLWLAALSAAMAMCEEMNMSSKAARYSAMLKRAKTSYHEKLWNGTYYNYDTSDNPQHDSIMTDMCCGQWWARACGLPPLDDVECLQSALATIYKYNVKKFRNGELGPINGMRPDGKIDQTCMQSVEVWTGTAYGCAATMMQEGLLKEGFETAKGIVNVTYETIGYMYQTPEAWDVDGHYRAIGYMRPLSIWGMQYAWEHFVSDDLKKSFGDGTLHHFEERRSLDRLSSLHLNLKESVYERGDSLSRRKVRKDVVTWCIKELKLPEDVAEEYEYRLSQPKIGVVCVDDLRWLIEEDMDNLEIPPVHKRKIMAWVAKNKP